MYEPATKSNVQNDASPRPSSVLRRAVAATRRTMPTHANADRLWTRYVASLKDDFALAQLVVADGPSSSRVVDGMTELLSCQDLFDVLRMPDCLTLEVSEPGCAEAPPQAFLMVPYATRSAESIETFRNYFLGTVFDPWRVRYISQRDEERFRQALSQGNLAYLADFVSPCRPAVTMALLVAAHAIIVDQIFAVPSCVVLGKCLDSVRLGACRNDQGNQRIKQLAEGFGLHKIGEAPQRRRLELVQSTTESNAAAGANADHEAELVFGLYMGDTARLAPLVRQYKQYLDHDIFQGDLSG